MGLLTVDESEAHEITPLKFFWLDSRIIAGFASRPQK